MLITAHPFEIMVSSHLEHKTLPKSKWTEYTEINQEAKNRGN